jgi:hypothetical protein
MKRAVAVAMAVVMLMGSTATAGAAPYVACLDGHIAPTLADCPLPRRSPISVHPGGGGGSGGGLLGTIGRVLGGLTGGLL